jgi:hypothetical protein
VAPKLIIAVLATTALLWPRPATAPVAAERAANDHVKVEHELIHVVPFRNAVTPPPPRIQRSSSVKPAVASKPPDRPKGALGRARRILLGDGRYRPEPFPRPAR